MNAPRYHGERTAHLDTAGTGRMPDGVRAVLDGCTALDDRFGAAALERSLGGVLHTGIHERVGALLGVPGADTVLAAGAAQAFEAVTGSLALGPRDRIWTTPHEGVAHLTALHALRDRARCRLEVVPLRPDGDLDLEWMRAQLDADVALVSVVHLSPACGTVNPVEEIGRILAPHRARYAVDASHSAGLLPTDAVRIGCDLLTADGWRFLCGPQGTGFAYVAPGFGGGRPQAPDPAAVAALDAALAHHRTAVAVGEPYEELLPRLRTALGGVPGVELLAAGRERAAVLAFRHAEVPAAAVRRGLARRGVVLGKAVAHETPLHPAGRDGVPALRASVHHDTTARDIDRLAAALAEVVAEALSAERCAAAARTLAAAAAAAAAAPPAGTGARTGAAPPSPYRARPVRRRGHLTLHRAN